MGASNYTYVEASATQRSSDWIASHVWLVEFLGGTPHALADPVAVRSLGLFVMIDATK